MTVMIAAKESAAKSPSRTVAKVANPKFPPPVPTPGSNSIAVDGVARGAVLGFMAPEGGTA